MPHRSEDLPPRPEAPPTSPVRPVLPFAARAAALVEVILCSDYPTQLALGSTFAAFGYRARGSDGQLLVGYIATLSLVDSALLVALILVFLRANGERPRDVFFGTAPVGREALVGLPLILVTSGIGVGILALIQLVAPALHTVSHNPLQDLLRTPRDISIFAVVVVVAGGVREEVQRAFLLRRFESRLGGPAIGVVVTSLMFGAGHFVQGADAAIATGLLGAFWALVYFRRRSVIAPVVSHSGFNLLQMTQFLVSGR